MKKKNSRNLSTGSGLTGSDQRASRDGGWSHGIANATDSTMRSNTNTPTKRKFKDNTTTKTDDHNALQTQLTLPCNDMLNLG